MYVETGRDGGNGTAVYTGTHGMWSKAINRWGWHGRHDDSDAAHDGHNDSDAVDDRYEWKDDAGYAWDEYGNYTECVESGTL
ncbi:MAG: hypothetical protein NVS4B8_06300 [Herpetosiphon sp.]